MITVIAVLALAVFGVGGAFAYRTFTGSARRGEPPIIRADAGPTKIIPAPTDGGTKVPDRMATGDGTEKIVPREETPVDLNARNGAPRVVFPPLNQNGNPPAVASVAPNAPPPANAANGTLPNNEPHKIKTLSVRGDAADAGASGRRRSGRQARARSGDARPSGHRRQLQLRRGQCQCAIVTGPPSRRTGGAASSGSIDQPQPGSDRAQRERQLSGADLIATERDGRAGLL